MSEAARITISEDTLRRVLAEFKLELVQELQLYARQESVAAVEARIGVIERDGSIGTRDELRDHEMRVRALETQVWLVRGAFALVAFELPILIALSWRVWG